MREERRCPRHPPSEGLPTATPAWQRPSDHLIPGDQVSDAIAALSELTEAGVEVDGELQVAESTWVIYGHTIYDGEIIVGEYHDAVEAAEVLQAAPSGRADHERLI